MAGEQFNPYAPPNYPNQPYPYQQNPYARPDPWQEREQRLREWERNMSQFGQITPPPPPPPVQPPQYGQAQTMNAPPPQAEQPTTRGYAAIPVASVEQAKDFTIPPDQLQMKFILPQNVDMQDGRVYVKYVDPNTYEPVFKEFIAVGAATAAANQGNMQPGMAQSTVTPSAASPNAAAPYSAESPQNEQQGDSAKYLTDDDIQPLRCEISGIVAMMDKMSANIEKMCAQIEDLEGLFDESGLDSNYEQSVGTGVHQDKPSSGQSDGKNPADSKPKSK